MTTYVGLLRAVNLGPHNRVAMADLRGLLAELGFGEPRTLLQSGNVVFRGGGRSGAALERQLQQQARTRLALATDFFVRTAEEWALLVDRNPFPEAAERDPGHLILLCLKDAPAARKVNQLRAAITGREVVRTDGRQAYIIYPDGIGNSGLTNGVLEKWLDTRATGRNWNTVRKLHALAGG